MVQVNMPNMPLIANVAMTKPSMPEPLVTSARRRSAVTAMMIVYQIAA